VNFGKTSNFKEGKDITVDCDGDENAKAFGENHSDVREWEGISDI